MSDIFQTQFNGKIVNRKFYEISQDKINEFQNTLGFLPNEFLTFDNGQTYKICVQYSKNKFTESVEHPTQLLINVDENGNNGNLSEQLKCINEFEEYFYDYGMLYDVTSNYLDVEKHVYYVNSYWDGQSIVTDERFIKKICEDYFWSYSINFDNIKLHNINKKPIYKKIDINLIGSENDLPDELLKFYSNQNLSLYVGIDKNFYYLKYIGPKNLELYADIAEDQIKNEDIIKTFFTIYSNYLNTNFENSWPYYQYDGNNTFYKLNSQNTFYNLHKFNNKYFLTHHTNYAIEDYNSKLNELSVKELDFENKFKIDINDLLNIKNAQLKNLIESEDEGLKIHLINEYMNNIQSTIKNIDINEFNAPYYLQKLKSEFNSTTHTLDSNKPNSIKFFDQYKTIHNSDFSNNQNAINIKNLYKDLFIISNIISKKYNDYGFAKYIEQTNISFIKNNFGYKVLKENINLEPQNYSIKPNIEDFILINNQENREENGVYYYRQLTTSKDFVLIKQYSTCMDNLLSNDQNIKVDYVIDKNININEINKVYNEQDNTLNFDFINGSYDNQGYRNLIVQNRLNSFDINAGVNENENSYIRRSGTGYSDIYLRLLLINQNNPNENGYYKLHLIDEQYNPIVKNNIKDNVTFLTEIESPTDQDLNYYFKDNLQNTYQFPDVAALMYLDINNNIYFATPQPTKINDIQYVDNDYPIFIFKVNSVDKRLEIINDQNEINLVKATYIKQSTRQRLLKLNPVSTPDVIPYTFIKDNINNKIFSLDLNLNTLDDFTQNSIKFVETNMSELTKDEYNSVFLPFLNYDDFLKLNSEIQNLNPSYYNLLKSQNISDEIIIKTRLDHLNEILRIYKNKIIELYSFKTQLNAREILSLMDQEINMVKNFDILKPIKDICDINEQLNVLKNNVPVDDEIICKDLIILKNIINNSPLKINQSFINDLNLSYLNLTFNDQNVTQITPKQLYDLFNYTAQSYEQNIYAASEYSAYQGFKLNITEDKCWICTVSSLTDKIKFKFFNYTLTANFFKNNIEESLKINDKITITASPRFQFKDVTWNIGTQDTTGNLKYNLVNERNPADNKFARISMLQIKQVDNQLWHIFLNNNQTPFFSLQPKQGTTMTYIESKGFIHNDSILNPIKDSSIILTRLNLNLENDIEIYIRCNAINNDILETAFTKLIVKKLKTS